MSPAQKPAKPANAANPAKASGFTIIEVALVLAIAGLIFLVVFLALPALQRSQRDTARRQDVAKAAAAIQQFYADGGDPMAIPANPSFTGSDSGTALGVGDTFDKVPILGAYLQSAGLSSNETRAKVWPFSHTSAIKCSQNAFGGVDSVEIWVGCKCSNTKDPRGAQVLAAASPYETAVTAKLESGSGGGHAWNNVFCATASR